MATTASRQIVAAKSSTTRRHYGVVYMRTWRDMRRTALILGILLGLMAIWVTLFYPMISQFEELNQLLESPFFSALLGDVGDYTSPAGFLGSEFAGFMPLFLAVYTVYLGLNIIGKEEELRIIDVLLSTPIPRWQIIIEKSLAILMAYFTLCVFMILGFAIALPLVPSLDLSLGNTATGVINMFPSLIFITTLAFFFSNLVRRRGRAAAIVGGIVVASYFITALSDLAAALLDKLQYLSFYTYYDSVSAFENGLNWGNVSILLAGSAVLYGLALWLFQRRDLGT